MITDKRGPEQAVALPFTVDSYGKIATATSQSKIWADRVRSVIGTAFLERVMRPNFGCETSSRLFDSEEFMQQIIRQDLTNSFQTFLPVLRLLDVEITLEESTRVINVEVYYLLPNDEETSLSIGVAMIDGNQPLSEVISWRNQ